MSIHIRHATDDDAAEIADIYNQGISEREATFETEARTPDDIRARLRGAERFPVLVAEDGAGVIEGAGSAATELVPGTRASRSSRFIWNEAREVAAPAVGSCPR